MITYIDSFSLFRLKTITIASKFMKIFMLCMGFLLNAGAITGASAQTEKLLTLDAAVKLALEKNVQIIQARNRYKGTDATTRAAYGRLFPTLSASGSFSRSQQWQAGGVAVVNGVPVEYPDGFSAFNNFGMSVSSSLTLFDGMANFSGISRAKANASGSRFSVKRTEQTVIVQTHVLFLSIARAHQLLNVADDNLKRSRRQLERITESNKVGAIALADVYRQQVQVGSEELALIQAQSNFENTKADLVAYIGVEYDESAWTIDVSEAPTDIDTLEFAELNQRYQDFESLVATAVAQRPDYQSTREAVIAASSSVTIATAGHLPSVRAGASYGYSNPELSSITDNRGLNLSVNISVPIFNGFQTSNSVEQAKIQEMNAQEDLKQAERQLGVDIRKAKLNLDQAEKSLIVSKSSVFSAEMDRKIAEEKYNLGAGTLLDMLVATANYTNAVSGKVNSIFDYLLAKKEMEYSLGIISN